jgi:hypothetical protein
MNIIFLDIDGVMNMYGSSSRTFMKPYGHHIEPHLVCRLNYICENVKDLKIVISSSWRSDMEDLQKQLEEQGFKYWNLVIGKTCKPLLNTDKQPHYNLKKDYLYMHRGEQIAEWLWTNQFKGNFLVIDDEINDICGSACSSIDKDCVYEIDLNEGMLHKDTEAIIKYFHKA